MILVMVGTHPQPFNRLVMAVDQLAKAKKISGKVVQQIGYSTYEPKYTEWFRFIQSDKMVKLIKKSDLIITHGGIGSILLSLKYRKPTIIVPRLKKFGEHTDDHQLEIVRKLEEEGMVIPVYEISHLQLAMEKAKVFKMKQMKREKKIFPLVKGFLKELER